MPIAAEEYAPECFDGTLDCTSGMSLEEWAMTEDTSETGADYLNEEYPPECLDGTAVCDWGTIEQYYYEGMAQDAAAAEQAWYADEAASQFITDGTECYPDTDFTQAVELRVIQMRSGYTYTATVLGVNGFNPALAVLDPYGNGVCVDDDNYASTYSAYLPTTGQVDPSVTNAQITFTYNGAEPFADISLWVASSDNMPGEFVLVLEGMAVTDGDGMGDPLSLSITPSMVNSGIYPTGYMMSLDGSINSFVGLIDGDYNWILDENAVYVTCDDAGYSCWGNSAELTEAWVSMTDDYWVGGWQTDAMLNLPIAPGYEGGVYNFVMRSWGMETYGEYLAAFHLGIG
jgi:hypothetical protein